MAEAAIHQHRVLQERGGAAAVARILARGLADLRVPVAQSFEVREQAGGEGRELAPGEVGRGVPAGALLHAHGSLDWPSLLVGLAGRPGPVLITLHDCAAFTGGCPFPLECKDLYGGCPAGCPRGFPAADRAWRAKRELFRSLRPALAAPSRWLAREAEAVLGLPVAVAPNGVPWPDRLPDKAAAKRAAGLDPAALVALFAAHGGREAAYKAGDRWVWLWERLRAATPGLVGIMAGGGDMERRGDLLAFPYVPPERLAGFMAAADVFVYPTLADNHPLVVLEAMAQGCAVAAFAAGGVPEQVVHESTGLLVRPGDWDGLAGAASGLLNAAGAARRLGRAAHAAGRERFAAERMVDDYLGLYRELLAGSSPRRAASMKASAASAAGL
ncbi:MAG: glycosyltransferase [Thermodesulfobacteriota bacterium]